MAPVEFDEASSKKLHPFFTKPEATELPINLAPPPTAAIEALPPSLVTPVVAADELSNSDSNTDSSRKKRRKTDTSLPQDESEPKKQRRKRKSAANPYGVTVLNFGKPDPNGLPTVQQPLDIDAEKESATSSLKNVLATQELQLQPQLPPTPQLVTNLSTSVPVTHPQQSLDTSQVKKVLKFNPKTGTFGSPPKPKTPPKPSRIVFIKYGRDEEHRKDLGNKITQILDQAAPPPPLVTTKLQPPKAAAKSKNGAATKTEKSKATHPFFGGKAKAQLEPNKPVQAKKSSERNSVFMSTPVSPRKSNLKLSCASSKAIRFGMHPVGTKVPGAMHPLWPPQGFGHIRGHELPYGASKGHPESQSRKSKGMIISITPKESVLQCATQRMNLKMVRNSLPKDDDAFSPAPAELRLPRRHFESGKKLQQRIRPQLQTRFNMMSAYENYDSTIDELSGEQPLKIHPALRRSYDSLVTQLSAYDTSTCESRSWIQKYAPTTAGQVLQPGKEALLISQWLQALRVQAVEGVGADEKGKSKPEGGPKKKRKKNKSDGFIVESDEDGDWMDELSDDENDWAPSPGVGFKKSVIRNGNMSSRSKEGRLTNTIVISGPHGSGKTAAVYAIAKELEFEIFEINAGSRRSGKDILEKVGDMTRNHLVQQGRAESTTTMDAETGPSDISSGKQGMMTSFFKPKAANGGSKIKKQTKEPEKETQPTAPKGQKQSLILIEEVDILFEEDKQFWTSLTGLIAQSKRPFIMTCNDESLVPLHTLSLHGIFRFAPAPSHLAVDLCLLIAANEGHCLERSVVESLYSSRKQDLRATITELNYWCQIGVGDRRGGFDWFYLRWPKGSDLDENGHVVRVISEGTYQKGMGLVARDEVVTTPDPLEAEEGVMRQGWDSYQLDMGDWNSTIDMAIWSDLSSKDLTERSSKCALLEAYEHFCDSLSAADICSNGAYGVQLQEILDPSVPAIPNGAREDFILGQTLLDAEPLIQYASPNKAVSTSIKSLARETLRLSASNINPSNSPSATLNPVNEQKAVSIIDSVLRVTPFKLARYDIAVAFDPIAVAPKAVPLTHLDPSVFDRTLKLIVLDVAPWVRGIVAYEHQLMQKRLKLSSLLSEGGSGASTTRKRMRNTRSAYSALEGGERRMTRRERHFGDCLTMSHVMRTAGEGWTEAVLGEPLRSSRSATPGSPLSDGFSQ